MFFTHIKISFVTIHETSLKIDVIATRVTHSKKNSHPLREEAMRWRVIVGTVFDEHRLERIWNTSHVSRSEYTPVNAA